MPRARCYNCGWVGDAGELVKDEYDDECCPKCGGDVWDGNLEVEEEE